jgi:hypothetical protein
MLFELNVLLFVFQLSSRKAEGLALRSLGNLHCTMRGANSTRQGVGKDGGMHAQGIFIPHFIHIRIPFSRVFSLRYGIDSAVSQLTSSYDTKPAAIPF